MTDAGCQVCGQSLVWCSCAHDDEDDGTPSLPTAAGIKQKKSRVKASPTSRRGSFLRGSPSKPKSKSYPFSKKGKQQRVIEEQKAAMAAALSTHLEAIGADGAGGGSHGPWSHSDAAQHAVYFNST
jgi:hypothetical protein